MHSFYAYCFNTPINTYDDAGYWPTWLKKAVAVVAVATAVVVGTAITVATCGAGSVAGIAAITTTLTLAAHTTEVVSLQVKKGRSEGKGADEIFTDSFEAVYDNVVKIAGLLPISKPGGIAYNYAKDCWYTRGAVPINCTLTRTGDPTFAYLMVGYAWGNTAISLLSNDPVERATTRGYELK